MGFRIQFVCVAVLALLAALVVVGQSSSGCQLQWIASYESKTYDEDAAEKVAYDAQRQVMVISNANEGRVDIVSIADPTMPEKISEIDVLGDTKSWVESTFVNEQVTLEAVQSIEVSQNLIVAGVEAADGANGWISVYGADDFVLRYAIEVGPEPDALAVGDNEAFIVGAVSGSEGAAGGIVIIELLANGDGEILAQPPIFYPTPSTWTYDDLSSSGVLLFDPSTAVDLQLKPEGITIDSNANKIFLNYQDNNAIASFDIATSSYEWIQGYGSLPMTMDASDKDGAINIVSDWDGVTIEGFFMPDEIVAFDVDGVTYIVTANEGGGDPVRLGDVGTNCANNDVLIDDAVLGRLEVFNDLPFTVDSDGLLDCDNLYAASTRSMSIFRIDGNSATLVWDSGSAMEELTSVTNPNYFNSNDDENEFDSRSDAKGPEPEGATIGRVGDKILAFITIERVGGIFTFDITNPTNAVMTDYLNRRNFGDINIADQKDSGDFTYESLDVGPENLAFIPADVSPTCSPLLLAAHAISGTTAIYEVVCDADTAGRISGPTPSDGHCEGIVECNGLYPPTMLADVDRC